MVKVVTLRMKLGETGNIFSRWWQSQWASNLEMTTLAGLSVFHTVRQPRPVPILQMKLKCTCRHAHTHHNTVPRTWALCKQTYTSFSTSFYYTLHNACSSLSILRELSSASWHFATTKLVSPLQMKVVGKAACSFGSNLKHQTEG